MEQMLKKNLNKAHMVFGIYYAVICCLIIFGPFVKMFDRTDIWVAGMPLSQFWIILASFLIAIGLCGHYYTEKGIYRSWRKNHGE